MVGVGAGGDPGLEEVGGLRVGDGAVVEEGAGEGGFGVGRVLGVGGGPILLFQIAVVGVDLRKRAGLNQGAEVSADCSEGWQENTWKRKTD